MSLFGHLHTVWQALGARTRRFLAGEPADIVDYPFARSDVALYYRSAPTPDGVAVDQQTWDDMLLDDYADTLGRATSIFGQQTLHRRLRLGGAAAANPDHIDSTDSTDGIGSIDSTGSIDSATRVRALLADAPLSEQLGAACLGLRHADAEVSAMLFDDAITLTPQWMRHLWLFPLTFMVSVALALFWWPGWFLAAAAWVALIAMQMRYYQAAQEWERLMLSLQQMLRAHSLLGKLDVAVAPGFRSGAALAGKINRAITPSPVVRMVPAGREYSNWVLLDNIKQYVNNRTWVVRERAFLRASFALVGDLEADLALVRHLRGTTTFCWATPGAAANHVTLTRVVHPLLEKPAPLSLALEGKGAFISGQNGIGKSTLLRTLGLNLIVARAFGFCYAQAAALGGMPVYSSMQGEDTLAGGESLYIAELRRARELLALAEGGPPALFIIDEIFRGTNHLESISAAAAVLHTLAAAGVVVVSSHNLVLAPLLEDCLTPLCVSAPAGDTTQLRVAPGVLVDTNGLALLATRGFGGAIEAKAGKVYAWLSAYLAHPRDGAHVLRHEI